MDLKYATIIYPIVADMRARTQKCIPNAHDTHTTRIRGVFEVAISPSIHCNVFPMVPCTLPVFFLANLQMWFYHSTTLLIVQFLCNFVLQLVETAVCFIICMIQHVFCILIYSFNHIFIKLSWIEDKQQQHFFSIEGKIIACIGYTLSIKVIRRLVNLTLFLKIWESIQTGSIPTVM